MNSWFRFLMSRTGYLAMLWLLTSQVIQKATASEFSKLVTTLSPRLWLSWDLLSQFVLQKVCWQFRAHDQYPADLRRCCRKPKGDLNHLEFFESDHFVSFHEMTFIRPFETKKKCVFCFRIYRQEIEFLNFIEFFAILLKQVIEAILLKKIVLKPL